MTNVTTELRAEWTKTIAVNDAAADEGLKQYLLLFLLKSVIVFLQNCFKVNFLQMTTKMQTMK